MSCSLLTSSSSQTLTANNDNNSDSDSDSDNDNYDKNDSCFQMRLLTVIINWFLPILCTQCDPTLLVLEAL